MMDIKGTGVKLADHTYLGWFALRRNGLTSRVVFQGVLGEFGREMKVQIGSRGKRSVVNIASQRTV